MQTGLTPQHLKDMLAGAPDEGLLNALVDFTNPLLMGNIAVSEINDLLRKANCKNQERWRNQADHRYTLRL